MGARRYLFSTIRGTLSEVLTDRDLASLGDAYVNFVYSIAFSNRRKKPLGVRVKGTLLAEGLRQAGLRHSLGSRMSRHSLADAGEALIVYAWLNGNLTLDESVAIVQKNEDPVEGARLLLETAKKRVTFP